MYVFSRLSVAAFSQWGIKLLLLVAIGALVVVVSRQRGARHAAMLRLGSFLFAILAIGAVVFPSSISTLARWIGVGRGTDLLLYLLVVVFLAAQVVQWRRQITVEARLTALTRELALTQGAPAANGGQVNAATGPGAPANPGANTTAGGHSVLPHTGATETGKQNDDAPPA